MTAKGDVVIVGGEPAALSCAARLLREGASVIHVFPGPWGLEGASRDIGLAYPELGEPLERLVYALGEQLAGQLHAWGKAGIELLTADCQEWPEFRRGSRLQVSRHEREARLTGSDALDRQRLGDEVRLMSGGAASNYAPLATTIHEAIFETHAAAFAPVPLLEHLQRCLLKHSSYRAVELNASDAWLTCQIDLQSQAPKVRWGRGDDGVKGDALVLASGYDTTRLLGTFSKVLVPLLGQAFRSEPLRETTRSSVVGLTASWGHERYRFDADRRLLGCGIDPTSGDRHSEAVVLEKSQEAFWKRANTIFSDLVLSGPEILRWGVLFTSTCDGLPLLGPLPGEPRVHLATGFSTSAWSRGYAAGDAVAHSLMGQQPVELLQRCSPRRFL